MRSKKKDKFVTPVNYVKVICKCGKVSCFLRNHSAECKWCGRIVYPSKKCEFKEKMAMKLRKELSNHE